jgi:tRNA threonylcarbamoyladenosine biosynthesis protein TsaB
MRPSRDLFLCLDTATPTAHVAVIESAAEGIPRVLYAKSAVASRHSSHVLPLCAEALEAAGVTPAGLAGIACGGGPGSFTGLRVGLAVAKGMALPGATPLFVVSSLEALALDILEARGPEVTAVPCIDAGKGEVHLGVFRAAPADLVRAVSPPDRRSPGDLPPLLETLDRPVVAGNGAERYREAIGPARCVVPGSLVGPTAVSVGRLALVQRARGEAADFERVVPSYGRAPDITVKAPKPA